MAGAKKKLIGLVVCGGKSSRMGHDKSMLSYHGIAQCYHMYHMLQFLCKDVFISCNQEQFHKLDHSYKILPDAAKYHDIGPIAALLTAFDHFPAEDFLITGCDYPFITQSDLSDFSDQVEPGCIASAFYNEECHIYEPLLACYSASASEILSAGFLAGHYSLQHFLKENKGQKYVPASAESIRSVDTPEEYAMAKTLLANRP